MGSAINITSSAEFNKYISASKLTVVDFTATWCGPCKAVAPRFEALAAKFSNCSFIKVDVDEQKDIAQQYGVRAMPTFMLFKSGKKLDEVVGADIGKVERLVNTHAAGSSGFPSSGGRVLGSGAGTSGNRPAATAGMPNIPNPLRNLNLTPMQQQYAFILGMLVLFYFLAKQ
ncbi:thioredoxin-like protein [Chytriomyces sp. MP71]|nr:thioredoxin-like protein [Chytriomyces sp. MP71]